MLSHHETADLLIAYGIPLAPGILSRTVEETVDASETLDGVDSARAVKLISAGHTHKSEAGFVRLGLKGREAVATACREMMAQLGEGEEYEGFLVQPMIRSDRELILGAHLDPQFGPVVAFGPGGILVDILGGVDFLAAPFSHRQALDLVGRNAASALLGAVRGWAAVDRNALAACLVALGRLIADNQDRVVSVDINPLVVVAETGTLLALDFRAEGRTK